MSEEEDLYAEEVSLNCTRIVDSKLTTFDHTYSHNSLLPENEHVCLFVSNTGYSMFILSCTTNMRLARICKPLNEMKPQTLEFGQIIVRL